MKFPKKASFAIKDFYKKTYILGIADFQWIIEIPSNMKNWCKKREITGKEKLIAGVWP